MPTPSNEGQHRSPGCSPGRILGETAGWIPIPDMVALQNVLDVDARAPSKPPRGSSERPRNSWHGAGASRRGAIVAR